VAQPHKLALQRVFRPARIRDVFKDHVWAALRGQQCKDLLFYYDYRRGINDRADLLSSVIAKGNYRPKASLPISISRSDLLARHMHIPHPDDALVLQCISESLLPLIEKQKPSPNALFARSHQEHAGLHKSTQQSIYPWFRLWPRYQMKILNFAKVRQLLVVTDVQNFFDSVGFAFIRRQIVAEIKHSQTIVDLMLLLFENFIRRDMYAPITLQGIPTIDVDAPRLVGHALLFDIDRYLKQRTNKCFARWLDDINFGVNTVKEARELIRHVDAILRKVGLRLAGGKTQILSYDEARRYLQADENQRLNVIENTFKKKKISATLARRICLGFTRFRKADRYGYWDKVMRRYYGFVARANANVSSKSVALRNLLRQIEAISNIDFSQFTATDYRESIIRFWQTLRPTDARIRRYIELFKDSQGYDDATAFALANMLLDLPLTGKQTRMVIRSLIRLIPSATSAGFYYGACWFLAKHGSARDIVEFLARTENLWASNYFFARQAVVLWSLLPTAAKPTRLARDRFTDKHDPDISLLIEFIERIRQTTLMDDSLKGVLPINPAVKHLDLTRAILSSNVMRSPMLDTAQRQKNEARIRLLASDKRIRDIALGGTAS
jgi:hypothetical protein